MRIVWAAAVCFLALPGAASAEYVAWATDDGPRAEAALPTRTYWMQELPPEARVAPLSWSAGAMGFATTFVQDVATERHVAGPFVVHVSLVCDQPVAFDPLYGRVYVDAWWPGTSLYTTHPLPPLCDGRVDLAVPLEQDATRLLPGDPVQVALRVPAPNAAGEGLVGFAVGGDATRVEMQEQPLPFDRPVVLTLEFDEFAAPHGRLFTDAAAVRLSWNGTLGDAQVDVRLVDLGTGDLIHHAQLGGHAQTMPTAGEVVLSAGPGARLELQVSTYSVRGEGEHMEFFLTPHVEEVEALPEPPSADSPGVSVAMVLAGLVVAALARCPRH